MSALKEKRFNESRESSTELYKIENEYVLSLPRTIVEGAARPSYPDSALWIMYRKLISLKTLRYYIFEVFNSWTWFLRTKSLKGRGKLVDAIVIGNGPSQGFLDGVSLSEFKKNGGEIICTNLWTDNELLRQVVPTYMVVSDPAMFSEKIPEVLKEKHDRLVSTMKADKSIGIICPLNRCQELSNLFGEARITGFVDQELRMWTGSINPLFPRGYVSMTLYKALAIAIWFNYNTIYLIGMDNTYPRNIYCDQNNKIISHELHACTKDFSADQSALYKNVSDALVEMTRLFIDIQKFKNDKIINLDPYSITDVFKKVQYFDKVVKIP